MEIDLPEISEDSLRWINNWMKINSVWGRYIYNHCIKNGYMPDRNCIAEDHKKKLLHHSDTFAVMIVVIFYYHRQGSFITRRQLSIALDKHNPKAKDAKIARDLDKLSDFGLLIHNGPSLKSGARGARYIEPTSLLLDFFNQYCKGA